MKNIAASIQDRLKNRSSAPRRLINAIGELINHDLKPTGVSHHVWKIDAHEIPAPQS